MKPDRPDSSGLPAPSGLEHEAAEWIARRYEGLSPVRQAEFERWLHADPRHAAALRELDEVWQQLDRVRLPARVAAGAADPDALALRRPFLRRFVPLLAAAAALAVAWLGWNQAGSKSSGGGIAAATTPAYADAIATDVGHLRKVDLPDGSVVRVNADSRIEVAYTAVERRVRLVRGEAHFTVTKNPPRPFVVDAAGVAVRAVGTAFNVRLRPEAIEVLVTEGRVRVADAARDESLVAPRAATGADREPPVVQAGERVVIAAAPVPAAPRAPVAVAPVEAPEMERLLAWRDRRIEVVAAPLGEIVAEFNRYNRGKLVVAEPELAARRFGGSFRADEPETFVRLLETRFGLRAERQDAVTVLQAGQ